MFVLNKSFISHVKEFYELRNAFHWFKSDYNNLRQKIDKLEKQIIEYQQAQQRHKQELRSLKRDLILHSNVFIKDEPQPKEKV